MTDLQTEQRVVQTQQTSWDLRDPDGQDVLCTTSAVTGSEVVTHGKLTLSAQQARTLASILIAAADLAEDTPQ